MRAGVCAVVAVLCGWAPGGAPARADGSPVFVVPGKPGVPVIVNPLGFDASCMVVEGDFGLSRPGQVNPVIVGGPLIAPAPYFPGGYFPSEGQRPGYGRYEVDPGPNRRVPPPAPTYHRFWGTASDPIPATLDPPAPPPNLNVDVLYGDRRWRRNRHRPGHHR